MYQKTCLDYLYMMDIYIYIYCFIIYIRIYALLDLLKQRVCIIYSYIINPTYYVVHSILYSGKIPELICCIITTNPLSRALEWHFGMMKYYWVQWLSQC